MRRFAAPVITGRDDLVDTAGTGGGRQTFNVSTTAALIAAGAGCAVAKHGNRSATGLSGSADVLEALGVRIDLDPAAVGRCIEEVGFGFMFAPAHHGATRFVIPVRKELAVRTIFNFLGPLTNPAGATRQLIGVSDPAFLEMIAGALARLGARKAFVVSSDDGLDELSTAGATRVVEVDGGEAAHLRGHAGGRRPVALGLRGRRGRPAGGQRRDHAADPRRRARPAPRPRRAQRRRRDLRRGARGHAGARRPRRGGSASTAAPPRRRWTGSSSSRVSWRRLERARPHRRGDARRRRAPPRDRAARGARAALRDRPETARSPRR